MLAIATTMLLAAVNPADAEALKKQTTLSFENESTILDEEVANFPESDEVVMDDSILENEDLELVELEE